MFALRRIRKFLRELPVLPRRHADRVERLIRPGDRFKVKATPWLRRSGLAVHNGSSCHDWKAWPGEIGTVERREWTCLSGEKNHGYWLVFTRGRQLVMQGDLVPVALNNPEDFVRVK